MNHAAASWGVLFLMIGCASRPIEVGTSDGGDPNVKIGTLPPPSHGPDDPPFEEWPDPGACVAQSNLPLLVGKWNGYIGRWQNAVADFQVDIRGASDAGGICGTVTFKPGSTPPPPATDPDSVYPDWGDAGPSGRLGVGAYDAFPDGPSGLVRGFNYTILTGRAQAGRATFTTSSAQPMKSWCGLQFSYPGLMDAGPDSDYACLPPWDRYGSPLSSSCYLIDPVTSEWDPVSCAKAYACGIGGACQCNAARCVAKQLVDKTFTKTFDLTFSATEATGTMDGRWPNGEILLTRAP